MNSFYQNVMDAWAGASQFLLVFTLVFAVLTACCACNPGMQWWSNYRAALTNVLYWFFVPLFNNAIRPLCLAGMYLAFNGKSPDLLPVEQLPFWLQIVMILLLQDLGAYWIHRLFHGKFAWKFHAIHHSTQDLDWISMARFHPVNLLEFVVLDLCIVMLGFSMSAMLYIMPVAFIHSAIVHANLNWTFGPFRYVLASPVFHRWHHTSEDEGLDKNFAPTFPFLDLLFGTFYMPPGKRPATYGTKDVAFPETFLGQMAYPFKTGA